MANVYWLFTQPSLSTVQFSKTTVVSELRLAASVSLSSPQRTSSTLAFAVKLTSWPYSLHAPKQPSRCEAVAALAALRTSLVLPLFRCRLSRPELYLTKPAVSGQVVIPGLALVLTAFPPRLCSPFLQPRNSILPCPAT